MKLTDKYIKGIQPRASAYRIFEKGGDKGFGLKVIPSGAISFFIQYAAGGKQRFYNLGRYPSVSLSEARDRCRETRLMIDKGEGPQNKVESKHGTVANLFDYYITKMQEEGKRSWPTVKRALEYNCHGIMNMSANSVEPTHIRKILHDIIARGSPEKPSRVQANRVRSYLKRAFELGIYHDNDPRTLSKDMVFKLTANPVNAIPKDADAETVGQRTLSEDEVRILWLEKAMDERHQLAVKLLLIYGCRPWELCGALKPEFDFKEMTWTIPADRVKNKRVHLLPITPIAAELIGKLLFYASDSVYLFPGRYDDEKPIHHTSLQHATNRVTCIKRFTPRDLRRTWKTLSGKAGIEKSIRDRIQNHALTDVSSVHYDRYEYLPEKREALERWEQYLIDLLRGKDDIAQLKL